MTKRPTSLFIIRHAFLDSLNLQIQAERLNPHHQANSRLKVNGLAVCRHRRLLEGLG